ncbi:MAG: competence protein CoiA family protein [Candidatus Freyarchaeota archaeon]
MNETPHSRETTRLASLLRKNDLEFEYTTETRENRIDLAIMGRKIAIELQLSRIPEAEAAKRTLSLNSAGWAVLWILSGRKFPLTRERQTYKIERFLHRIYYGRIYYFKRNMIIPVHFEKVVTERDFNDSYYVYYHKRTRRLVKGPPIKEFGLLKTASLDILTGVKYQIARFYDKKFW